MATTETKKALLSIVSLGAQPFTSITARSQSDKEAQECMWSGPSNLTNIATSQLPP